MLIQLASFDDVHFDVDVLYTCPIKFIQDMLRRKRQARPSPIFPELRDFHLISEIVLADNHLPKQVPRFFPGVHHLVLTICVDKNSVSVESNV